MNGHASVFTNQTWKPGSGLPFHSQNPATQEILWQGRAANSDDIHEAVQNAKSAFPIWSNLTIDERSRYLNHFGEILEQSKDSLAIIISKETGKPLWESKIEISSMTAKIGISLEAYGRRCANMIRDQNAHSRLVTRHCPHGVLAIFGPYNFPGHLPNGHIIPALLAGNTIVLKPSELTPLVAEEIIKCWHKANLPPGVINLVQGGAETGQALAKHPDIDGVLFTGSLKTGKILSELFATQLHKILVLELGGNNPFIVSQISDPKVAAFLTIQSAYLSSGQRCTCARRLIVPKSTMGEQFIETLIATINQIVIGPYDAIPEPYMGPVISEATALKILAAQKNLASRGGKTLVEMKHLSLGTGFLSPGLMDVTDIKNRPDEEIFGPFLQLIWVENFEQAVEEANRTQFGLAAGLLSESQEEYDFFYRKIRAGVVNWNTQLTGASSAAPFGGIKSSGNHRPSGYYAADYCSYPVSSSESHFPKAPTVLPPGLKMPFILNNES